VLAFSLRQALYRAAQEELERLDAPGTSLAVALDGRVVFRAQVGHADLAGEHVLPALARFPVYSLTKTLIAAVVLQLVGEGQVALDGALAPLLPELELPAAVTVRRLLSHTAGLPDYGALAEYRRDLLADPARPWSVQTFLDRTLRTAGVGPAGTFAYSNVGYVLLRLLIEGLTGQPLGWAMRERLFAPQGLRRTSLVGDLAAMGRLTPGDSQLWGPGTVLRNVVPGNAAPRNVSAVYHPGWVAHGLVASTAAETARLFGAIVAGRLVPPELLPDLLTPLPVATNHAVFSPPTYGLGLMMNLGGTLAGHGGGGPGYSAGVVTRLSGPRFTAAALVNRDRDEAGLRLAGALLSVLEGNRPLN
jgi:D-alanyl-D-alanine carboxypeptidase